MKSGILVGHYDGCRLLISQPRQEVVKMGKFVKTAEDRLAEGDVLFLDWEGRGYTDEMFKGDIETIKGRFPGAIYAMPYSVGVLISTEAFTENREVPTLKAGDFVGTESVASAAGFEPGRWVRYPSVDAWAGEVMASIEASKGVTKMGKFVKTAEDRTAEAPPPQEEKPQESAAAAPPPVEEPKADGEPTQQASEIAAIKASTDPLNARDMHPIVIQALGYCDCQGKARAATLMGMAADKMWKEVAKEVKDQFHGEIKAAVHALKGPWNPTIDPSPGAIRMPSPRSSLRTATIHTRSCWCFWPQIHSRNGVQYQTTSAIRWSTRLRIGSNVLSRTSPRNARCDAG
jgi:hypothetical protein